MFDGWIMKMFYDITNEPFLLVNNLDILNKNIIEIIEEDKLVKFVDIVKNLTEKCLMSLSFESENGDRRILNINERANEINEHLAFII